MWNVLIFIIIFLFNFQIKAQNVEIVISNIRSTLGEIRIGVFKDQNSFDKENAYKNFVFKKNDLKNGTLKLYLNLEPGLYGIAVLDDENSDGKMKYNFLGMPTEGFGFSNFESDGLSKPKFSEFSFRVGKEKTIIFVKMRYIL